jgi:micrococcal nuclease
MSRKNMKFMSILFFMAAAIFYLVHEKNPLPAEQKSSAFVPVVEVHDGDTVSVTVDQKREKVRLVGIDAPEMGQKPWGEKAKKYLETLLSSSGWKVKLEYDVEKKDKYGRILAYLWTTEGEMINLLMLKKGYATLFTFPPNVKHVNEFRAAQRTARDGRLGIWSEQGLKERPGDYRRQHPRI